MLQWHRKSDTYSQKSDAYSQKVDVRFENDWKLQGDFILCIHKTNKKTNFKCLNFDLSEESKWRVIVLMQSLYEIRKALFAKLLIILLLQFILNIRKGKKRALLQLNPRKINNSLEMNSILIVMPHKFIVICVICYCVPIYLSFCVVIYSRHT